MQSMLLKNIRQFSKKGKLKKVYDGRQKTSKYSLYLYNVLQNNSMVSQKRALWNTESVRWNNFRPRKADRWPKWRMA